MKSTDVKPAAPKTKSHLTNQPDAIVEHAKSSIRLRIDSLGWSIAETADRAGIPRQNLSAFLNSTRDLRGAGVLRLMAVLGGEIAWQSQKNSDVWPTCRREETAADRAREKALAALAQEVESGLKARGINQLELSQASGVHASIINRLVTRTKMPSDAALKSIRQTLARKTPADQST